MLNKHSNFAALWSTIVILLVLQVKSNKSYLNSENRDCLDPELLWEVKDQ